MKRSLECREEDALDMESRKHSRTGDTSLTLRELDEELFTLVFCNLPPSSYLSVALTCKKWKMAITHQVESAMARNAEHKYSFFSNGFLAAVSGASPIYLRVYSVLMDVVFLLQRIPKERHFEFLKTKIAPVIKDFKKLANLMEGDMTPEEVQSHIDVVIAVKTAASSSAAKEGWYCISF